MKELSVNMEDNQNQENEVPNKTESTPPEPPKKTPLQHKWTLWFYENNRRNDWLDNLHNVYSFDTIEDFWSLFNNMRPIHSFGPGNDYALFKEGIQPIWEDPKNNRGGKWTVTLESRPKNMLAEMWLHLSLFLIGESFGDYGNDICGAYINMRGKHDRISLWTSDATKISDVENIGKKLKYDCLNLPDLPFTYESHEAGQRKSGSKEKPSLIHI